MPSFSVIIALDILKGFMYNICHINKLTMVYKFGFVNSKK